MQVMREDEAYVHNELNKVRTKDLDILPNLLNQRFIVLNSFNEFSDLIRYL